MADTKITALSPATSWAVTDVIPVVDVSDTGMAASGTTKYIEVSDLFGASTPIPSNLNFAATQGVQFNSGDVFDAYDKGSWTPVLFGSSTAGSHTYSIQLGSYVRIGDICLFGLRVQISSLDTMAGQIRISGLPFTSVTTSSPIFGVSVGLYDETTITVSNALVAHVRSNESTIALFDANAALTNSAFSGNVDIMIGGAYEVA